MLYDIFSPEFWDYLDALTLKAFEFLTQKSLITLVIQGVLLTFSLWDKNSRFFVILAAIGVYSIRVNFSVWDNIRRRELAERRTQESRSRQYALLRSRGPEKFRELMFIPEEEIPDDKGNTALSGYFPRFIQKLTAV
ncbi:MAG: hypothetical protein J6C96_04375 [Oscillospiraceae bacterium]|nr:hypothetical protein [Oscillospiraceae bacterium]